MNPAQQKHSIKFGEREYRLNFAHRDFAAAQYQLNKQGVDVKLLGPRAVDFWHEFTAVIEGEEAEQIRELVGAPEPEDGKPPEPLFDIDFFKLAVLLYAGLRRSMPDLTFDIAQDMITQENEAYIAATVIAAVHDAMAPYIKTAAAKEAEASDPLASGTGGASESPTPAPLELVNANSGE